MMISSKGRYAIRVLADLAMHSEDGFVSLKTIAERQNISLKYLELIISSLHKNKMVESLRGKDGGYKLAIEPSKCTIGSILKITETSLAPVNCIKDGHIECSRADSCITLPMWKKLDSLIDSYLESVSLQDLL